MSDFGMQHTVCYMYNAKLAVCYTFLNGSEQIRLVVKSVKRQRQRRFVGENNDAHARLLLADFDRLHQVRNPLPAQELNSCHVIVGYMMGGQSRPSYNLIV